MNSSATFADQRIEWRKAYRQAFADASEVMPERTAREVARAIADRAACTTNGIQGGSEISGAALQDRALPFPSVAAGFRVDSNSLEGTPQGGNTRSATVLFRQFNLFPPDLGKGGAPWAQISWTPECDRHLRGVAATPTLVVAGRGGLELPATG